MSLKNNTFRLFFIMLSFAAAGSLKAADFLTPPATRSSPRQAQRHAAMPPLSTPPAPTAPESQTDAQQLNSFLEQFLTTIRSFDLSKAYYAFTARGFQKEISLETFKQFIKQYSVFIRNRSLIQENVTFNGPTADYTGTLVSVDGEVYKIQVVFVNVEDEWKIHSISLEQQPRSRSPRLR